MAAITLRSTKGSRLTVAELDQNFTNLNVESATKVSAANPTFTGVVTFTDVQDIVPSSLDYPVLRPSLLLDFVNSDALDPRITFSRASTATRTNARGLLESVGTNAARFDYDAATNAPKGLLIEEQRTNLLTYSAQLTNAAWTKLNTAVTPNMATAPDGSMGADLVTRSTGVSAYIGNASGAGAAGTYTLSVYAQASTVGGGLGIRIQGTFPNRGDALFNLNTGVVLSSGAFGTATNATASITPQSNGWYRCSVTVTLSDILNTIIFSPCETTASVGGFEAASAVVSNCVLWGAQLEAGSFVTSYIPSVVTHTGRASTATYINSAGIIQTAALNIARYQYDPANLTALPYLLLESAATNSIIDSAFNTSSWTVVGSGLTNAAIIAPNGVVEADKLTETAGTNEHYVRQIRTSSITAGAIHTMSVYVKAAERNAVTLRILDNTNYSNAIVLNISNISAGTILNAYAVGTATYINSSVTAMPNSWLRISLTGIVSPTTTAFMIIINAQDAALGGSYLGILGSGIYVWGAQLEAGTYATSYIPTTSGSGAVTRAADTSTSAQATRAQDAITIVGTNFSNWYNPQEGTLYAEVKYLGGLIGTAAELNRIALDGAVNINTMRLRVVRDAATPQADTVVFAEGISQMDSAGLVPVLVNTTYKRALAYANNNAQPCVNSVLDGSAVGVFTVPVVTRLSIPGTSTAMHVARIAYYPKRLSNTELQALTV